MKDTHYDQDINADGSVVNVTINGNNNKVIAPSVIDSVRQELEEEFFYKQLQYIFVGIFTARGRKSWWVVG